MYYLYLQYVTAAPFHHLLVTWKRPKMVQKVFEYVPMCDRLKPVEGRFWYIDRYGERLSFNMVFYIKRHTPCHHSLVCFYIVPSTHQSTPYDVALFLKPITNVITQSAKFCFFEIIKLYCLWINGLVFIHLQLTINAWRTSRRKSRRLMTTRYFRIKVTSNSTIIAMLVLLSWGLFTT